MRHADEHEHEHDGLGSALRMSVSGDPPGPHAAFRGTQRFRVVRQIGSGGMGVVYEAEDLERGVVVALKTLKNRQADALLRFRQEFRALQDLAHPNLVRFGELFEEAGDWFFTMELVPGTDFLAHVRPSTRFARSDPTVRIDGPPDPSVRAPAPPAAPGCDEARLRDALSQLAAGLVALHDAGKIHRDIKPSNLRVTPEGRVVLLDFGLVADRMDDDGEGEQLVVGTAAYMAPEQGASRPVGIEADWYAVGAVLYESLVGRLPFEGSDLQVLMDKQRREPIDPRRLGVALPDDLGELCMALLRFDPARRAGAAAVLSCASPGAKRAIAPRPRTSHSGASAFVGRAAELEQLAGALADVRAGSPVSVLVDGESGIGKSALVRRFVEEAARGDPQLVVLSGRCYERESVPYKALDGVLGALGRHLRRIDPAAAARLVPRHAGLLPVVFPSLARVELLAQAPRPRDRIDPQELRARVFTALRGLFGALAARAPLVVTIDDLQWADADSFALLAEILRPPAPPPILLLATTRSRDRQAVGIAMLGAVRRLTLERLGADEARALATTLLSRAGGDLEAAVVADEAAGHPLFIDELVRHAVEGHASAAPLHLDEALWARVSGLEAPVRELLELLAVAGGPVSQEILAEALEARFDDLDRRLGLLRVANLARTTGSRRSATRWRI